ncbi:MAG: acetyl-CoA decarbonylase/synthase complex subunit delta [Anaerolineales bacterium]|nr:acetyl-CoA decarbonylase/synthase complex subunit delta [Anaerolineales bacterium]
MPVEIPKEKWTGVVRKVTLGATSADGGSRSQTVTVGGESTLPFLFHEGSMPHRPVVAIEIRNRKPDDWSQLLEKAWGDAMNDPGEWAKAAEKAGAELIVLTFNLSEPDGSSPKADHAKATIRKVLDATGLPVAVNGPGQAEIDNEIIVAVAEEGAGERLLLGICEDRNYRTIVAAALGHGHLVQARTAMDVNLAKQLNILINDMQLTLDRIVMDPTTGALGYGIEYGYSVMERLRIAALQGDSMTQLPMMVTPGEETWKTKESKVGEGVPAAWGDWEKRAINWEVITATSLIESGADIVVVRHPESVRRVRSMIDAMMAA